MINCMDVFDANAGVFDRSENKFTNKCPAKMPSNSSESMSKWMKPSVHSRNENARSIALPQQGILTIYPGP